MVDVRLYFSQDQVPAKSEAMLAVICLAIQKVLGIQGRTAHAANDAGALWLAGDMGSQNGVRARAYASLHPPFPPFLLNFRFASRASSLAIFASRSARIFFKS